MNIDTIEQRCGTFGNACKYLHELVLENDLKRADLFLISEQSSSQEKSGSSNNVKNKVGSSISMMRSSSSSNVA